MIALLGASCYLPKIGRISTWDCLESGGRKRNCCPLVGIFGSGSGRGPVLGMSEWQGKVVTCVLVVVFLELSHGH
jgi:hypothetical protein